MIIMVNMIFNVFLINLFLSLLKVNSIQNTLVGMKVNSGDCQFV